MDLDFHKLTLCALPSGGLWIEREQLLVVADLHLGKGGSYADSGRHLPPYDARATLETLEADIAKLNPSRVWALGDSFHRADSPDTLSADDRHRLTGLAAGRDWQWVTGNHDLHAFTRWKEDGWPGDITAKQSLENIRFLHQPDMEPDTASGETPQIFGHFHPKVRVALRNRRLSGKCFLMDDRSLLLPAYGSFTGGLWWPHPDLAAHFSEPRILLCHGKSVHEIDPRKVRPWGY